MQVMFALTDGYMTMTAPPFPTEPDRVPLHLPKPDFQLGKMHRKKIKKGCMYAFNGGWPHRAPPHDFHHKKPRVFLCITYGYIPFDGQAYPVAQTPNKPSNKRKRN